jgi:ankyrin repeat protein
MLNSELVKGLLQKECSNPTNSTILKWVLSEKPIPKEMWSKDTLNQENDTHWSALTAMIALNRLEEIPREVLSEDSLNQKNSQGLTPLHRAIMWGQIAEANYLLELGANPSIKSPNGKSCEDLINKTNGEANKVLIKMLHNSKLKREKKILQKHLSTEAPLNI